MIKSLSELSDEELYALIKESNRKAYTELYNRFKRPLLVYALKKVGSEVAEDLVHDIFSKLWVNRELMIIRESFVKYAFSAVRNGIIDYMNRSTNSKYYLDSLENYSDRFDVEGTDHKIREEYFMAEVNDLLRAYGPKAYTILRLRMQGYKNHEIAQQLNITEKTVRNRHSVIIKFLKSKLSFIIYMLMLLNFMAWTM